VDNCEFMCITLPIPLLFAAVSRMRIHPSDIKIAEYSFQLPAERIANFPLEQRDQSKLLVYKNGQITDDKFFNLANHLPANSSLILNNTRVIEARLLFHKATGGMIEIFLLEPHEQSIEESLQQTSLTKWNCLIGGASKWKHGQILSKELQVSGEKVILRARYLSKETDSFTIELSWSAPGVHFIDILHAAGAIPLPPYIKRSAEKIDADRYQTIFGKYDGSVAAPTAALHFTDSVFNALSGKNISSSYVTLHVGAGTFKPVKSETIAEHEMHSEAFTVHKKTLINLLESDIIIAVGTTSLRTLESLHWLGVKLMSGNIDKQWELHQWEAYELDDSYPYKESLAAILQWMNETGEDDVHCRTSLLIVPGYNFKIPSAIITNFHQPNSTLLLLVAAFAGNDWKNIYEHALENDYRFLSYGDSSLLWRNPGNE
jgi:S-adenosylmethionine:tRNA ribosyltransferase-isomerase